LSISNIKYKDWTVGIFHKPKLKYSYIKIDSYGKIIIKTASKSQSFALELLQEKESWIQKQLNKNTQTTHLNFNLEDEVLLFGECYSIDSNEATYLREKLQNIKNSNEVIILHCYNEYYKKISQSYLTQRVEYYSKKMNLEYSSIKYRKMRSRWGSCSSKKVLTFNSELMKIKKELIDYVVVHELSHLVHMNHSKAFHDFVDLHLNNSKILRKELKNIRLL
jgi:predicted metal-dependent hydrolase